MPTSKPRKAVAARKGPTAPQQRQTKKQANRERLDNQIGMLQGTVMQLRGLYDQAVMEKSALEQQIAQRDRLLTAMAVEYGGRLETDEVMYNSLEGQYTGYEITREDNQIVVEAVGPEFDEDEDAAEAEEFEEDSDGE